MKKKYSKEVNPFYWSKSWRNLREQKITDNPLCELCESVGIITPATVVDHIIPIEVNEDLKLEYCNLQSLCDEFNGVNNCHRQKTGLTKKYRDFKIYVKEMVEGKLQYICTPSTKENLLNRLKELNLY